MSLPAKVKKKPFPKLTTSYSDDFTIFTKDLMYSDDITIFTKDIMDNAELIGGGPNGRFGSVYYANTSKFGKVAVKLLHKPRNIKYLKSMMRDHHINIVRFLGLLFSNEDESVPTGYVMEYMENDNVSHALHKNDMLIDEGMQYSWICQAGRALDFLHGKDLIHRDVHPTRMLLCNSYKTLRLGGIGLCVNTKDPHFFLDESVGTYFYKAPELYVQRSIKFTSKIDVYSLGICIFEIITRRRPYEDYRIGLPRLPDSTRIKDILIRLQVERTWSTEPKKRPTMAEIVAFFEKKLQAFLKLTAKKKTVFYSITADANIFTMEMFKDAERVGSGMYGNVFKTRTDDFGNIAAKIFKNCVTEQEQREIINMIKHSNHSNIVRFLGIVAMDVSSTETTLGYVMEYMPDKTVYDAIHNEEIEMSQIRQYSWISQAAMALVYLHGRGILHRDVKPLNMLLCDSRRVLKLCDMGMAKNFKNGESLSIGIIGTLEYVAPEVLNATRKKDAYCYSADVYSMAISSWEIVSRRKPYEALLEEVSIYVFGNGVINGTIRPSLEEIDNEESKTFLERAWSADSEMRPQMKEIATFFDNKRRMMIKGGKSPFFG